MQQVLAALNVEVCQLLGRETAALLCERVVHLPGCRRQIRLVLLSEGMKILNVTSPSHAGMLSHPPCAPTRAPCMQAAVVALHRLRSEAPPHIVLQADLLTASDPLGCMLCRSMQGILLMLRHGGCMRSAWRYACTCTLHAA